MKTALFLLAATVAAGAPVIPARAWLEWDAPTDGPDGIMIQMDVGFGFAEVGRVAADVTEWQTLPLVRGRYRFRVLYMMALEPLTPPPAPDPLAPPPELLDLVVKALDELEPHEMILSEPSNVVEVPVMSLTMFVTTDLTNPTELATVCLLEGTRGLFGTELKLAP